MLEREVKLRFASVGEAREAILRSGATPVRGRRLQEDCLLDTPVETLRARFSVLRVRMEPGRSLLTFKGPIQPSTMKLREELETVIADGDTLVRVFEELGFRIWFRYQKYREEFGHEDVLVALDETPIGVFVEIEGSEEGIHEVAAAMGRRPSEYLLDSYRGLFVQFCEQHGLSDTDMVFDEA